MQKNVTIHQSNISDRHSCKTIDVYGLSNTKVNKLSRRCLLFMYAKAHNKNQKTLAGWEKAIAMTKIWVFSQKYIFRKTRI